MAAGPDAVREPRERVLVIERVIDAPRELVFKVWSQPEHLVRWWGPEGFSLPACDLEFRPGGAYRFTMRAPDGVEHVLAGRFREIVPPARLVFTWRWAGGPCESADETLVTVGFEAVGDRTRLTIHQALFATAELRDDHEGGWTSMLDRLAAHAGQLQAAGSS